MRVPSYLHRNRHGVFGFRAVIPKRFRVVFKRREFRVTLSTSRICDAKRLARLLSAVLMAHFARLSKMSTDDATAQGRLLLTDLANARDQLGKDLIEFAKDPRGIEQRRDDINAKLTALAAIQDHFSGLVESLERPIADELRKGLEATQSVIEGLRASLMTDILHHEPLEAAELRDLHKLREKFQALQFSLEHSEVVADNAAQFETRKSDMKEMLEAAIRAAAPNSYPIPPPSNSATLSEVLDAYCANQLAEKRWTEKSAYETRAGLQLWLKVVGDQPIDGYGYEKHRSYKATLQKLPANLNKKPRYQGLSISEVIELGDPPASVNTVGNQLSRVASLFNWAVRYGYTKTNPASGMALKKSKRASDERQAFSDEDLKKLFHGADYLNGKHRLPYMYWAPLIALYTGARLNEIAQLHLADFVEIEGGHAINVNDRGDSKRVKTKAAERTIPIHSELIRLGLIRFVEMLREKKQDRLFPELKALRDGYGQTVSKWFRRYRLRCGIAESGKVFHSFRHTVVNTLKQAGHPKEKIAALVGHEDESVTFGRYGKSYEPKALREIVSALDFARITSTTPSYFWR